MTAPSYNQSVMQRDFKTPFITDNRYSGKHAPSHAHWMGLAASIAVFTTVFFILSSSAKATRNESLTEVIPDTLPAAIVEQLTVEQLTDEQPTETPVATRISVPLAIPGNPSAERTPVPEPEIPASQVSWQRTQVKPGDSMAVIFSRQGLTAKELYKVMSAGEQASALRHLTPGQELNFHIENNRLQQLVFDIDPLKTLQVIRDGQDAFRVETITRELETRVTNATGVIDSSLFVAGQKSGLSENLIMELAGIFGWDIDFVLDIRGGDRFTVVYEELFLNGRKQSDGNIIAAEFINQGKTYRALRYTNAKGHTEYYSPDGRSMRKEFLRTPVDFTRISSRFGKRMHPTLGTWKNHHGVDYAAPRGTPIKASGDGKITYIGNKGGYGKTIIIKHGGKYSTLYAHMSSFRRGMRPGKGVKQGQVIGYVGTTGRSTGPHLHYEFRVNGVHHNPLTVRLPDASPINIKYRADFENTALRMTALLDILNRSQLAFNDQTNRQ